LVGIISNGRGHQVLLLDSTLNIFLQIF